MERRKEKGMSQEKFKLKKSKEKIMAEQFNSGDPIPEWPEGVIEDVSSPTGYSVDGRDIKTTDWVIYKVHGGKAIKSDISFGEKYEND